MDTLLITQRVEFECCYITNNVLNAHRYKLEASVDARCPMDGAVSIDFREFKELLNGIVPDQTYVYYRYESPDACAVKVADILKASNISVLSCPFVITAEGLCNNIAESLLKVIELRKLPIALRELKLRENNESYVTWASRV